MILSDIFIRRPVFAIVVNALLVALGLYGLIRLPVSELPAFDVPVVTVTTVLTGASPEQIESEITSRIEEGVGSIAGVDYMTSTSAAGLSVITVTFKDTEAGSPLEKVRAKIDLVRQDLPSDAEEPTVQQLSSDQIPVMYLSLNSDTRSPMELTELFETVVRTPLASLSGAGEVTLLGERAYAIRVKLDAVKLAAYDLTPAAIRTAIQQNNVSLPLGEVRIAGSRIDIEADTLLHSVREFEQIPILSDETFAVRLRDVAHVVVEADNTTTGVLIDGRQGLAFGMLRAAGANALDIAKGVRALLPDLRAVLPTDVTLDIAFDSTVYIQESVDEVFDTLIEAVVLVVLVLMLFLGSWRASAVTLVTIPISLIGTFAFMAYMGYSLNMFSLLAVVLSVGLVVDDAIVDVENVQRLIGRGLDPMAAAFVGSREIGFAVVATTLTLASVYLPIGFLPGLMGKLFSEFAFTLAVAVLISGFISRTLSPMMCAYMLRPRGKPHLLEPAIDRLTRGYRRSLDWSLRRRWLVFLVFFLVGGASLSATGKLSGELAPTEDQGYVFVRFSGSSAITYDRLEDKGREVSTLMAEVPEGNNSLILLGTPDANAGIGILVLKPLAERGRSAQTIGAELQTKLRDLPGLVVDVLDPGALSGGGQLPIQMVVRSTGDFPQLEAAMDALVEKAGEQSWLQNPQSSLEITNRRISVDIDRRVTDALGIDANEIATAISTAVGQYQISTFTYGTRRYNVILELTGHFGIRSEIGLLNVVTASGIKIPLQQVVRLSDSVGSTRLEHLNAQRSAVLSAGLGQGAALGTALDDLEALARASLPPGMTVDWTGPSRQFKDANAAAGVVFILALFFIFAFLAAQFESFRDPFVVLLVVPFSILGGMVALAAWGGSLNLYSGIGLITLIGLVAKQGILITEFANQLREAGRDIREAVAEAAATRLRAILMTTVSMIAGALPLIYNTGSGANGRGQIGMVIIGGLTIGTLLALYVVPATYTLLSRRVRPVLPRPPSDEEAHAMLHGQYQRPDGASAS